MDFQKAFDNVPHERRILKLIFNSTGNHINQWIVQWLTDRRQRIEGGVATTIPLSHMVHGRELPSTIRDQGDNWVDVCLVHLRVPARQDGGDIYRDAAGGHHKVHGAWLQQRLNDRHHRFRMRRDLCN